MAVSNMRGTATAVGGRVDAGELDMAALETFSTTHVPIEDAGYVPSEACNWPACGCDHDEICATEFQRRRIVQPEHPFYDRPWPSGWWLIPSVLVGLGLWTLFLWAIFLWAIFRPT